MKEITTHVEMTSPKNLNPGKPAPKPIRLELPDPFAQRSLVQDVHSRVGLQHEWRSSRWTEKQWMEWFDRDLQRWIAFVGDEPVGIAAMELQPEATVEILSFGLVPEFVGIGYGGHFLTIATQLAWSLKHPEEKQTQRVWLHTCTKDHANALPNYQKRGFRIFKTETSMDPEA